MRRRAALVAALAGLAAVAGWLALGRRGDAPREVRALLDAQQAAWNAGDLDGFLAGYWDDERLTFYSGGSVNQGLAAVRERYRRRYQAEGKEMGRLTFSDLEVEPMGRYHALARGRWRVEMAKEAPEGLFTLALYRFLQGWKITHDHTSQAEPPKR